MRRHFPYLFSILLLTACSQEKTFPPETPLVIDTPVPAPPPDTLIFDHPEATQVHTGTTTPAELVAFARTLKGVPYQYASCDPKSGFDCSGFIYYVFNHFDIKVPRSSADFTNVGHEVSRQESAPGDLILFTGTDSSRRTVGHIGIVLSNDNDSLQFIHSSSGSANSVTISPLDGYYEGRFMKVIRVFPNQ